jgi:hypothetical protein
MLRVLNGDSVEEPGRGAPPILRLLYREAGEVPYVWRSRYNIPPNDPRFLELDEDEMIRDLVLAVYAQHRARKDDPNDPIAAAWERNSDSARRAILRLRKEADRFTRQVQHVVNPKKRQSTKVTLVKVITEIPERKDGA